MDAYTPKTIGIVDIETSHPGAWIPILRQLGFVVKGIFDNGMRYSKHELQQFAKHHGVHIYSELDALATEVDMGFILSVNWDVHHERAKIFWTHGKPVFIDKPMVGSVHSARLLLNRAQAGQIITGGSSLRFSSELQRFRRKLEIEEKTILSVYTCCSGNPFYQGVHLVSLLQGLLGKGIRQVRFLGSENWKMELEWIQKIRATVEVIPDSVGQVPFSVAVTTSKGMEHLSLTDAKGLYYDFLQEVLPVLSHRLQPVDLAELLEVELAFIAGLQSQRQCEGGWVTMEQLSTESPSFAGASFTDQYLVLKK